MLLVGLASPRALIRTQSSIRRHFGSSDRRTAILVEDSFSLFQQFGSFPASRYHRQTTTYENPTVSAASSLGHTAATTTTFGVRAATTSALRGCRRAPTANFTQAGSRTMEVARPPSKVTPPRKLLQHTIMEIANVGGTNSLRRQSCRTRRPYGQQPHRQQQIVPLV